MTVWLQKIPFTHSLNQFCVQNLVAFKSQSRQSKIVKSDFNRFLNKTTIELLSYGSIIIIKLAQLLLQLATLFTVDVANSLASKSYIQLDLRVEFSPEGSHGSLSNDTVHRQAS